MILLARNISTVVAIENIPGLSDGDYGLGVSVSDCGDSATGCVIKIPTVNPMSHPFAYATHRVAVKSSHYMGYSLTVFTYGTQTTDGSMYGQQPGNFIRPVQDGGNLTAGSWGYIADSQLGDYSVGDRWHNAPQGGYGREIINDHGWQPDDDGVDERYITYGVNIGWGNHSDSYTAHVRYDVTPQEPSTPAILKINNGDVCAIGEGCNLNMTGIVLESVDRLGVDFNGDGQLSDTELCADFAIDDQYRYDASCTLPDFDYSEVGNVVDTDEYGGVFNLILRNRDGATMNTGHQITYYYQPRIDNVEVLNSDSNDTLTIKDSVGVIDMVSTDSTSMMLTDDGDVYLWGNTPLHDGNNWIFDKTMAPTMVKLPDLTNTDRIVDIDAYGNSYYAVSRQGYLYAWGDNSARQLPLDNNSGWIVSPSKSGYYDTNKDNRQANMVIVGDGFGATVDAPRSDDDKNMSSWGANNHGQLGRNSINDGTWMVNTVAEGSYPLIDGEEFIQADAGKANVIAVTDAGRVFTWGEYGGEESDEQYGNRLGFKATEDARRPHDITFSDGSHNNDLGYNYLRAAYHDESKRFIQVAMGDDFAIVLARDRYDDNKRFVYTIGSDNMGQNGDGFYGEPGCWAHDITGQFGGKVVVGFSTNGQSAAAWTSSGQLYVWGDNLGGKLGAVDNVLYAPVAVLGDYSIDKVALGGINYARTTNGRLLAWGGESNDGSFVGRYGITDITNQLSHPSHQIKVTGNNLDKSDVWLDFNGNEIMDEHEEPLAKKCVNSTCYLQISTDNAIVGKGYQIIATTPHGGKYLSGNSGTTIDVVYSTAHRHEERPNDEPLLDVNGDEFEKINQQTLSLNTENVEATKAVDEANADNAEGLKEEPLESNNGGDKDNSSSDEVQSDDAGTDNSAFGGSVDDSNGDEAKTEAGDESAEDGSEVDGRDDNATNNTECVCVPSDLGMNSNDCDNAEMDYECGCECDNDGEYCDTVNNTDCNVGEDNKLKETGICECVGDGLPDKIVADVASDDLLSGFSSSTQVQLIDSRRKGCLNSVSSVDIDDQLQLFVFLNNWHGLVIKFIEA